MITPFLESKTFLALHLFKASGLSKGAPGYSSKWSRKVVFLPRRVWREAGRETFQTRYPKAGAQTTVKLVSTLSIVSGVGGRVSEGQKCCLES